MDKDDIITAKLTEILDFVKLQKPVLSVRETAKLTGYTPQHIYQLVHKRKIPFYKKGRLYFKRSEVLEWMTDSKKEISASNGEYSTSAFRLADSWLKAKYFPDYQGEICLLPIDFKAEFSRALIFHDGVYTGRYIELYDKELASHSCEIKAAINSERN